MERQELIDAISTTIRTNDAKGITAEALSNILIEMVESSGSGSGSGSGYLKVHVPLIDFCFILAELTGEYRFDMEVWQAYLDMVADMSPEQVELLERLTAVIQEMIQANAETYTQIVSCAQRGEGLSILIDHSKFYKSFMAIQFEDMGVPVTPIVELSASQPAEVVYINLEIEGEQPETVFAIVPLKCNPSLAWADIVPVPPYMGIELLSNGGIKLKSVAGTLSVALNEGYSFNELEIEANNATALAMYWSTLMVSDLEVKINSDSASISVTPLSCTTSSDSLAIQFFHSGSYYEFTWNTDGTYTVTTLE